MKRFAIFLSPVHIGGKNWQSRMKNYVLGAMVLHNMAINYRLGNSGFVECDEKALREHESESVVVYNADLRLHNAHYKMKPRAERSRRTEPNHENVRGALRKFTHQWFAWDGSQRKIQKREVALKREIL